MLAPNSLFYAIQNSLVVLLVRLIVRLTSVSKRVLQFLLEGEGLASLVIARVDVFELFV